MKKLSSYLSAGIAATATFQSSDAATVVTLYGPGATSPSTTPATPVGIAIGKAGQYISQLDAGGFKGSDSFFARSATGQYFTTGSDLSIKTAGAYGQFFDDNYASFLNGAVQVKTPNYANISFNGDDGVYEAVGKFFLDIAGSYLIAIARNDDNSALSISAGKAAIDAVPEPSAIALLALGAGGMAMRRRRKVA